MTGVLVRISGSAPQLSIEGLSCSVTRECLQFPRTRSSRLPSWPQVLVRLDLVRQPEEHVTGRMRKQTESGCPPVQLDIERLSEM